MCITHKLRSRREVMKLAALSIPALALGTRLGEALAASGGAGTPSLERSSACPITARPPALRVGDVEITRIVETEGPMMTLSSFFSDGDSGAKLPDVAVEAHRSWLDRWALATDSTMIFSIQSLLVRTPRHLILVDTCLGGGAQEGARSDDLSAVPYFAKLRAAGVKPEDVDFVLCTHLHLDHTGWNIYRRDQARTDFPEREICLCAPRVGLLGPAQGSGLGFRLRSDRLQRASAGRCPARAAGRASIPA